MALLNRLIQLSLALASALAAQTENLPWMPSDAARVSAAQQAEFLAEICPGHATAAGCEVCPADTGLPQNEQWQIIAITFGHFLSPSSDDALISGRGCEPHVENYSGSFLFSRNSSTWKKVRYEAGLQAWTCKKLAAADGRGRLVCAATDQHQGVQDAFLYLLDPGLDPKSIDPLRGDPRGTLFFDVMTNLGAFCVGPNVDAAQQETITRVAFQPLAGPNSVRIVVDARAGKAVVPKSVAEKVCSKTGFPSDLRIAALSRRYLFIFDGQKIIPASTNPPTEYQVTAVAPRTSYTVAK